MSNQLYYYLPASCSPSSHYRGPFKFCVPPFPINHAPACASQVIWPRPFSSVWIDRLIPLFADFAIHPAIPSGVLVAAGFQAPLSRSSRTKGFPNPLSLDWTVDHSHNCSLVSTPRPLRHSSLAYDSHDTRTRELDPRPSTLDNVHIGSRNKHRSPLRRLLVSSGSSYSELGLRRHSYRKQTSSRPSIPFLILTSPERL